MLDLRDLRHAWRTIARMPLLATVVVISLGLGIGVNTTVFSWIQFRVLRPLPGVTDAGRFKLVEPRSETGSYPGASWLEYRDLQERLRAFVDVFAFRIQALTVGQAAQAERASGLFVSGNYFSALGLQPALGRFVRSDEAAGAGGEPVVVISHGYWQTRLAGQASAVGETLRVNDRELTIIGVTPAEFHGTVVGMRFDLWVPATLAPILLNGSRELEQRNSRGYQLAGRLRAEASVAEAQTELDVAMGDLATAFPETNGKIGGEVMPFWQSPRGPQRMLVRALAILQGIMLVLLLAVCGNTANLLLARASGRQQEVGIRLALGAEPSRVVRLLLTENLLLALGGAALGIAIAIWGTTAIRAVPLTTGFPVRMQTSVDAVGLAFAIGLAVVCALIFGAAPALQLARVDPWRALHSGTRATPRGRVRNVIMAAQVALALVVLIAAGLFFRSLREGRETDPGFRREGVLLAQYDLTGRSVTPSSSREFARKVLEGLNAQPDVEAVAIAQQVPLDIHGLPPRTFTLEGRAAAGSAPDRALTNVVTPGYFETLGIALRGSDFAELGDTTTPAQAIVNDEFVRRYMDNREAIGRRLVTGGRRYVIAGVASNTVYEAFGEPTQPFIYFSYRDRPAPVGQIHVRARSLPADAASTRGRGDEKRLTPQIWRVVGEVDASLPVYDVRSLTEHVETSLALRKIPARMFVVLGPVLLLLAAIGIYAVVACTVAHRTTEIGVRLALGATTRGVVAQIVGDNLLVVCLGALAGWAAAYAAYVRLASQPIDVAVFIGVPVLLLAVATVATWVPAARAASIDPVVALRGE